MNRIKGKLILSMPGNLLYNKAVKSHNIDNCKERIKYNVEIDKWSFNADNRYI